MTLHFTIPQSVLTSALATVSKAVASRPTHPILANIKIEAKDSFVTLTGFDLNIGITLDLPAQVVKEGAITVPSKLLNDIVSRLPDEDITFKLKVEGAITVPSNPIEGEPESDRHVGGASVLHLSCGNGKYKVNTLPVDEYPDMLKLDTEDTFIVSLDTIKAGLAAVSIAVSGDDTKRILTGVHLLSTEDSLEFAATDGHRLSVYKATQDNEWTVNKTIPAKALNLLQNLASDSLEIESDNATMLFKFANGSLVTRLLDGTYPSYNQLIPKTFDRTVTVERKLLQSALDRISVLADQKNNVVKLSIDATGQTLGLSVDSPDIATGNELLPAQISGDDLEIAFNINYLKDGLKTIFTTEVQIKFNAVNTPAIIVPLGGADQVYLLMPVQIRS